jgi:hypothetical protein
MRREPLVADYNHPLRHLQIFSFSCWLLATGYGLFLLEPAGPMVLVLVFGPPIAVAAWLAADTRHTRIANVLDAGWFFYMLWPIVLPWYVMRTRGPGSWRLTIRLYVLALAGMLGFISGAIVNIVVSIVGQII